MSPFDPSPRKPFQRIAQVFSSDKLAEQMRAIQLQDIDDIYKQVSQQSQQLTMNMLVTYHGAVRVNQSLNSHAERMESGQPSNWAQQQHRDGLNRMNDYFSQGFQISEYQTLETERLIAKWTPRLLEHIKTQEMLHIRGTAHHKVVLDGSDESNWSTLQDELSNIEDDALELKWSLMAKSLALEHALRGRKLLKSELNELKTQFPNLSGRWKRSQSLCSDDQKQTLTYRLAEKAMAGLSTQVDPHSR